MSHSQDKTEHLRNLGTGKMPTLEDPPGLAQLEAFPNSYPDRDYIIRIAFPEFTSLCPVTGQPDFGTIVMEYIPDEKCVESKSFKLYMFAYRSHHSFMETITNAMLDHMWQLLEPRWCRIKGVFAARGATHLHVFAERYKDMPHEQKIHVQRLVQEWKQDVTNSSC